MPDPSVQELIRQEALKQGIPPSLALAVAEQESSFNPTAIGPKLPSGESAVGTFQLLPSTAKGLHVDANDPLQNIRGGVTYLKDLLDIHQGDVSKVLATYGGVKTDTKYVPGVLARIQKFQSAEQAAPPAPTAVSGAPPKTTMGRLRDMGGEILQGLNPMTQPGRRNLAGMAGATAASILAPEIAGPMLLARAASFAIPLAGAYLGGAAEEGGEQLASGAPPPPQGRLAAMREAGREQMGYEAGGQVVSWGGRALGRRLGAEYISSKVSKGLDDAMVGIKDYLGKQRVMTSPSMAGKLARAVAGGAAKDVKDSLGRDVALAAETGPALSAQPIRDALLESSAEVAPMAASHQAALAANTAKVDAIIASIPENATKMSKEQVQALMQRENVSLAKGHSTGLPGEAAASLLPKDHPLPTVLSHIAEDMGEATDIPFAVAHQYKDLLDSAVNWDRSAKSVAERLSKKVRLTLRDTMKGAGHQAYEDATAAYAPVAKLFEQKSISAIQREALSNPGGIVQRIRWKNPASAGLIKSLTQDVASEAGPAGKQLGNEAWNAVREAWTHENLVAKGPAKLAARINEMEASNAGQEFIKTMYGDKEGQVVWGNLKAIGDAWQVGESRVKDFAGTSLAQASPLAGVLRDVVYATMHGNQITSWGARARLMRGPNINELITWAAYSSKNTQRLVSALTGPSPGMAVADLMRLMKGYGDSAVSPMPSHDQPGAPPAPTSTTASTPPPQPREVSLSMTSDPR